MKDVLDSLLNYFRENWPEVLWIVVAAGVASYFGGWRARSRWRKLEFLDRLNITLTTVEGGMLRIRTILEMNCHDIFLNPAAAKAVVTYARRTTDDDPILPIPKEETWQYLNALLNEISERFAIGELQRDLGRPVTCARYLLCLTCVRVGPIRTQKIRGMLVRKDFLANLPQEEPTYESPTHVTRWKTICRLAKEYEKTPHRFIEMEICL